MNQAKRIFVQPKLITEKMIFLVWLLLESYPIFILSLTKNIVLP